MKILKLKNESGDRILINFENVAFMEDQASGTEIYFVGSVGTKMATVWVEESIDTIMKRLK